MDVRHPAPISYAGQLAASKLEQLSKLLPLSNSDRAFPPELVKEIAEALFSRAPEDFLRTASTETLIEITREALTAINKFDASAELVDIQTVRTHVGDRRGQTTIIVCVADRPFVVDSLTEELRNLGHAYNAFLHPIVRSKDTLISLTYIEIDEVDSDDTLEKISCAIRQTLEAVIAVTDDFAKMKEAIAAFVPAHPEARDLLSWLIDGGFVVLGTYLQSKNTPANRLGILRDTLPNADSICKVLEQELQAVVSNSAPVLATKLSFKSPVHRQVFMDTFTIAGPTATLVILGMLTSSASNQEILTLPLAKQKVEDVLSAEGLLPNSHDYKVAVSILNILPTFDLFRAPISEIRESLRMMTALHSRSDTRVRIESLSFERFLAISIVMPKERYASYLLNDIRDFLRARFGYQLSSIDAHVVILENYLVGIFVLVPQPKDLLEFTALSQAIAEQTLTWDDQFYQTLAQRFGAAEASRLFDFYSSALPEEFRAQRTPNDAVLDVEKLESLTTEKGIELGIRQSPASSDTAPLYDLRIYKRGGGLTLSTLLPILENSGFHTLDETVTNLTVGKQNWASVYALLVKPRFSNQLSDLNAEQMLAALESVLNGAAENDLLNALLIAPALDIREVALCRTLAHYLWQIKGASSEAVIAAALVEYPNLTRLIIDFFMERFDPAREKDAAGITRTERVARIKQRFVESLKTVTALAHDRTLRAIWNIIEATVRTNFFHPELQNAPHNTNDYFRIVLKISCDLITKMPRPRPLFEIYVCSPQVEGVHLRGGKVARGGLRWSERADDFRTEILGLSKTQQVKNAIIVPVGAKGGFIVKGIAKPTFEDVTACYRIFIRSLLSITDNRTAEGIRHPAETVIYDQPDPYFVVAADKGTASFSDIANEIAQDQFGLWIGDAFASGGSRGYSHKKFGITARGAWEAVMVHFRELGLDVANTPFTVVGIGDMSGDVFGNGLIISDKAKLVGAFDHRHIFIDPDPDPLRSFAERKRLYDLPRSSWEDYDTTLISAGGGVFSRDDKSIRLTPQIRESLGIETTHESVSGQELIQMILRSPVDLLWNGGIGTYVKASFQDHSHAADRANDDVRIDATELRAKAVAEGGNLGFTQQGRIEYALAGGRVNTDAIDNSAGVDLSDHEVNLKILLSAPVARGELTIDARTELLLNCVDEVCESVIARNRAQSTALSLITEKSYSRAQFHINFMRRLEKEGLLDRKGEGLPDDETLLRRASERQGLTRPEAAVLLAYAKMSLYTKLLESEVPNSPALEPLLLSYFPQLISERYADDIRQHPLRKEIVSTQIVNILFERMDPSVVFRLAEETGASEMDVVSAFMSAWRILDAAQVVGEILSSERAGNAKETHRALHWLSSALYGSTRWLLLDDGEYEPQSERVAFFAKEHQSLLSSLLTFLPSTERKRFDTAYTRYVAAGFSPTLAHLVSGLAYSTPLLEVVAISADRSESSEDVAKVYADVGTHLHVGVLLAQASGMEISDYWDMSAWRSLLTEVRLVTGAVVRSIFVEQGGISSDAVQAYFKEHAETFKAFNTSVQEFEKRPLTLGALYVLTARLKLLVEE